MAGKYIAEDISNLTIASVHSKGKKEQRIEVLEDLVDKLTLEIKALKKQLSVKPQGDNKKYKEKYEKLLPKLQEYYSTLHPF